MGTVIE